MLNIRVLIGMDNKIFHKIFWIIILSSLTMWFFSLMLDPQNHQMDIFYIRMGDFWGDAANPTGMARAKDPYHDETTGIWNANYPPLAYLLFYLLANVSEIPERGYLQYYYQPVWTMLFVFFLLMTLLLLYTVCMRQLTNYSHFDAVMTVLSLCLSYPMLHTLERGNILILSVLATSIFIFYHDNKSKWKKEISLVCLGLAIGIKLSPAIFGILLICKKDWGALFRTSIYTFILFFLPFLFFEGGFSNLFLMLNNMKLWFSYHIGYTNIYGTGLVASYMKYLKFFFNENRLNANAYLILTILRFELTVTLLLGILHFSEKWKQVLNITLVLLVFPAASHTYNVLYLIPFSILFLQSFLNDKVSLGKIIVFMCLLMIFFVYRCAISDFFNFNFAIPILALVSLYYSIEKCRQDKNLFNINNDH